MNGKKIQTEILYLNDIPTGIRSELEKEKKVVSDGRIYLLIGEMILTCEDSAEGNELVCGILSARRESLEIPKNKEGILREVMLNPGYTPDEKLIRQHRIDLNAGGTVTVFQSSVDPGKDLNAVFSAMVPLERGDTVISIDRMTVAFIRKQVYPYTEELKEFTEAVIGTMESEGIISIRAGIGREGSGLEGLRNSYREAREALEIGKRFYGKSTSVFSFGEQTLERILNAIPREKIREIEQEHPGICSGGLSDEIRETVRVFFRNDLNMTATARKLFIHRNTLNYRLDKIRKETGLDLRSFRDAVIFRILSGLPENN